MTNTRTIFIPLKSRLCTNCYGKRKVTHQPLIYVDRDDNEYPAKNSVTEYGWSELAERMGEHVIPTHPAFIKFKQINCPTCAGTGQEKYVDLSPLKHVCSSFPEGYFP